MKKSLFIICFAACICFNETAFASSSVDPAVDDRPLTEALSLPDWFKVSFLDIREDINEANRGRRGLIIYFGQSYCPYCKAHLKNNWGRKDIVAYTRANFDVIAINVRGNNTVTDLDGKDYSEKLFAARHKANFTPTVLFFDDSGKQALKLSGYRKPYQFRAALEFVADKHFQHENFRQYMARAEQAESFGQDTLNDSEIFSPPPFRLPAILKQKPLAVFFEERRCHSCDVLHAGPLNRPAIISEFKRINAVQLDMWAATPVTTPQGEKTTAKKWADELALDYAPTLIFYDESGKEIIRVDSVVGFLRLKNVLKYINSRAYRTQPSYQLWRSEKFNKNVDSNN
jgi:thioredoxin-related protein